MQIEEPTESNLAPVTVEKESVIDESLKPSSPADKASDLQSSYPADTTREKFEKNASDQMSQQQLQNTEEFKKQLKVKVPDTLQERQSLPTIGSPIRKRKAEAAAAARAAE